MHVLCSMLYVTGQIYHVTVYKTLQPGCCSGSEKKLWRITGVSFFFLINQVKPSNTPKKKTFFVRKRSQRDSSHLVKRGDLAIFQPRTNSNIRCTNASLKWRNGANAKPSEAETRSSRKFIEQDFLNILYAPSLLDARRSCFFSNSVFLFEHL